MRTKIVATLGPASMEYGIMRQMVECGVRIFRLNFSHADAASFEPAIALIAAWRMRRACPSPPWGTSAAPRRGWARWPDRR